MVWCLFDLHQTQRGRANNGGLYGHRHSAYVPPDDVWNLCCPHKYGAGYGERFSSTRWSRCTAAARVFYEKIMTYLATTGAARRRQGGYSTRSTGYS
jgi:hypothetical protein